MTKALDRQEAFTTMILHLREQARPSMQERGTHTPLCLYRGPDGTKCAVGALIPDEAYHIRLECLTPHDGAVAEAVGLDIAHYSTTADAGFLHACQTKLHDDHSRLEGPEFVAAMDRAATRLADVYGLKVPA